MPELATTRTAVSGGAEGTQLKDELTEIAELEGNPTERVPG